MDETSQKLPASADAVLRQRRVELAREAFHEFRSQCFWFWKENPEISEETIPLIIRELRLNGGHRGYQVAAELCR